MNRLWCNGQWLDSYDFTASPTDRGLLLGLGLFETILAVDGRPIHVDLHEARMKASCMRLGWKPEFPDLTGVMEELIRVNELAEGRARLRLSITGGSGLIHDLSLGADHVIWITATPAADAPPSTSANLSPWRRNENSALAGLKCASYAENLIALEHATAAGFEETLFLNTAGHLCEAATSNVFVVKDGAVFTPPLDSGCLPGVTRQVVIEMTARLGISCIESGLTIDDLHSADEIFLTSSIRGVMGLARFENRDLPTGPVTRILQQSWIDGIRRNSVR